MSRSFKIKIIRGTDLKAADSNGKSDPYVKVFLVDEKKGSKPSQLYKTKTIKKTLNPEWNEELEIVIPADQRELFYNYPVKFDVFDKDLIGKDFLGSATFNFGYSWTSTLPANKEVPIKLPLKEKGVLHLSLTFLNQGHTSLAEHVAKPVPEGFKRVDLKSSSSLGTVVIPSDFEEQSSGTPAKKYLLNATKTTDELNSSLFITEQDDVLFEPSSDQTYIKTKVDKILSELKKEGAWQWCGPVEKFKIDDENSGLSVGYRSGSHKGDVFTTKYFFYLLGSKSFFTLTHSFTVKRTTDGKTPEEWVTYSQEQLAHAKTSVLNTLMDSLKIYPVSLFGAAEVGPL